MGMQPQYTVDKITTLYELVERSQRKYSQNIAYTFVNGDETVNITFQQFYEDVAALGTLLLSKGLLDDMVMLVGDNSYPWIVTYFAVTCSGNIIVPVDRELSTEELMNLRNNCDAKTLFYSNSKGEFYEEAAGMGLLDFTCNLDLEFTQWTADGKKLISAGDRGFWDGKVKPEDLAAILYTSGTTGTPKGVMLSHSNLMSDMVSGLSLCDMKGDTLLLLPLHHSYAFMTAIFVRIYDGSCCYISRGMRYFIQELQIAKPQTLSLVPLYIATFYKLITKAMREHGIDNVDDPQGEDLLKAQAITNHFFGGRLTFLNSGAAPVDPRHTLFFDKMGIESVDGYGTTECSPIISVGVRGLFKIGSVGVVLPFTDVKITDVGEDGVGEICVKGPHVMQGYYNMPEETAKVFDGEWYKTGDLGYFDEENFLYVSGRRKNLILLSNGKNVYPEEIEEKLDRMEQVAEVMVFEEDDQIAAEIFPDYMGTDPTSSAAEDIRKRIGEQITQYNIGAPIYKNIGKVYFRDCEFEKTASRKIIRNR